MFSFGRLLVCAFLFPSSYCLLLGALPVQLAGEGVSPAAIGLVVGAATAGGLGANLVGAPAIGRVPFRVSFWFSGTALLLAAALYLSVPPGPWMIVPRVVHGVALAIFSSAAYAWIAALRDESQRGRDFGFVGLLWALAIVVLPPIGLAVEARYSPATLYWICGGIAILSILAAPGGSPALAKTKSDESRVPPGSASAMACILLGAATIGALEAFLPMLATKRGVVELIPVYVAFGISLAAGRILGGTLADRAGEVRTAAATSSLCAVALWFLVYASGLAAVSVLAALYAFGVGGLLTTCMRRVSRAAQANQASALGTANVANDSGIALGAAIAGLIATYSIDGVVWGCVGAVLICTLAALFQKEIVGTDAAYGTSSP